MNQKVIKIIAIIIVSAMLILGVALAICGVIYVTNEDNIAILLFLDRAGADGKFADEMLGCIDKNMDVLKQFTAGELQLSDNAFCSFAVSLTELFGRLKGNDLGNALYGYVHSEVRFNNIGLIGKYLPTVIKRKDVIAKLTQLGGKGDSHDVLSKLKVLTRQNFNAIASQFEILCKYVSSNGSEQLSFVLDCLDRVVKYQSNLLEHVSLREIITSIKYVSQGLRECDDLHVTFEALNKLQEHKVFVMLSQSPQLINTTLNFVSDVEINELADIVSYTFYPNICVALMRALNEQKFIDVNNLDLLSNEIDGILKQENISNIAFKEFYLTLNQKDEFEKYVFDSDNLSEEQQEYVNNFIDPIIDCFKGFDTICCT